VLDVAAGPGTLALSAAKQVAHVSALDFSSAMIERLRRDAAALGYANIDAQVGDGQALPYPDGSFDAAFSMFGLIFFPDRNAGLRQLNRVLRPGGRVVIGSWAPFEPASALVTLFAALQVALPELPFHDPELPMGDPAASAWGRASEVAVRELRARLGDGEVRYHQVALLGMGERPAGPS